jgi:hypothetical protein
MTGPARSRSSLAEELLKQLEAGPLDYDALLQTTSRSPAAAYRALARIKSKRLVTFTVSLSPPEAEAPDQARPQAASPEPLRHPTQPAPGNCGGFFLARGKPTCPSNTAPRTWRLRRAP